MQISRISVVILISYLWILQTHGQFIYDRDAFEMQQKKAAPTESSEETDELTDFSYLGTDELTTTRKDKINSLQYESRSADVKLWSNGLVPFTFSGTELKDQQVLMSVIRRIEEISCVKFIFYPNVDSLRQAEVVDYIILQSWHSSPECKLLDPRYAPCDHRGRLGGAQRVGYQTAQLSTPVIARALGMHYEQQRLDRDNYVFVRPHARTYWFIQKVHGNDYGVPYNYQSVLHYPCGDIVLPWSRLQGNGLAPPYSCGRMAKNMAFSDGEKLRRMYNCDMGDKLIDKLIAAGINMPNTK